MRERPSSSPRTGEDTDVTSTRARSQPTLITTDAPLVPTGLRLHQVGETIAGYELVHRVKSGGMGSLWIGRRSGVGGFAKQVAIKVIHPHLGENQDFVRMFLDEARLTARIAHPNVIQVFDVGIERGCHFMVMELVPGCSLADASQTIADRGRRMRPDLAVAIVREVAAGLHAAHELKSDTGQPLNVVHRDVSPDNVLLGLHGAVKLIDFGIAKAAERLHETRQPTIKGKLRYLAPEQLSGINDRRTDVYALGVVLWELITGHRIYENASEAELLDRVRDPMIPSVLEDAPEVGAALDSVIATMTAPSPSARPQTAADAAAMLLEAFPNAGFVGAPEIGQLASAAASTGLGVGDGETATPTVELEPLTAARKSASSLTTARVPARRLPVRSAQGGTHGAMWIAVALVTFALIIAAGLVWDGRRASEPEMRATTLTPSVRVVPAPAGPSPTTIAAPSAPPIGLAPSPPPTEMTTQPYVPPPMITPPPYLPSSYGMPATAPPAPRSRTATTTPSTPPRERRSTSTPRTGRASVVDGTTLATEL